MKPPRCWSTSRFIRPAASRPDRPRRPHLRGRRDHPLLRHQHARRGPDHVQLRAHQRDLPTCSPLSTTESPMRRGATPRPPARDEVAAAGSPTRGRRGRRDGLRLARADARQRERAKGVRTLSGGAPLKSTLGHFGVVPGSTSMREESLQLRAPDASVGVEPGTGPGRAAHRSTNGKSRQPAPLSRLAGCFPRYRSSLPLSRLVSIGRSSRGAAAPATVRRA